MKYFLLCILLVIVVYNSGCKKDDISISQTSQTPSAPILMSPSNNANGVSIPPTLIWNASSGVTSYTLQISTSSAFANYIYNQSGLTNTIQKIAVLSNSTRYYWRVSANNGTNVSDNSIVYNFTTAADSIVGTPCTGLSTVLYQGKTYHTVQISSQCWLQENLDVGNRIDGSQNQSDNGTIEKYCYYDDPAYCSTFGGLYQWNEAMQYVVNEGAKGICPAGWHIPSSVELNRLRIAVNDDGNALKAIGQGIGTNTSGFSAMLAGDHYYEGGSFNNLGVLAYIWSSTEYNANTTYASYLYLPYNDNSINFLNYYKANGFSIRCIIDASL